jgi:hypothetical protein
MVINDLLDGIILVVRKTTSAENFKGYAGGSAAIGRASLALCNSSFICHPTI